MKFATGVVVAALVLGGGSAALAGTGHGGGGHGSPVVSAGGRIFTGPRVFVGPRVLVHRRDFVGLLSWRPGSYTSVDPTITSYYSGPNPVSDAAPPVGHQETPTSPAPPLTARDWHYCPDSHVYYPSTQPCPSGWLQVGPAPVPLTAAAARPAPAPTVIPPPPPPVTP